MLINHSKNKVLDQKKSLDEKKEEWSVVQISDGRREKVSTKTQNSSKEESRGKARNAARATQYRGRESIRSVPASQRIQLPPSRAAETQLVYLVSVLH